MPIQQPNTRAFGQVAVVTGEVGHLGNRQRDARGEVLGLGRFKHIAKALGLRGESKVASFQVRAIIALATQGKAGDAKRELGPLGAIQLGGELAPSGSEII